MKAKNHCLTIALVFVLSLASCIPAPETPVTGEPAPANTLTPTLRPETNVALLKPVRVSASWVVDPPERAVNGNIDNWWGAGGVAPQWIEVDLQGIYVVSKINVVEGPTARAVYQVFGRGPDGVNHPLHTFNVSNSGVQYLTYIPEVPLEDISTIRVEITNSGSGWVGIREIQVFSRQDPDPLPAAVGLDTPPFQTGIAWDPLEPINTDNAIMLEPISMLGRGIINDLAWSPDGKMIAAASSVGVWLYDAADLNAAPRFLEGHTRDVLSVAFVPDGQTLLSASQDGTVKVWEVSTGSLIRTAHFWDDFSHEVGTSPREKEVWSTAFSPDGTLLAAGSYDGTVRFWNVASGTARPVFKQHSKQVSRLAFSPDGTTLASGSINGEVYLWDVVTGGQRFVLSGHKSYISDLAFTPDSTMLASTGADGLLEVWVTASGEMLSLLGGGTSAGLSAAFDPAGKILAACGTGGDIRFYDLAKFNPNEFMDAAAMFKENAGLVMHMAFNPGGSKLLSFTYDGVLQLWDTASGELTQAVNSHTSQINGISFSPTGKFLATANDDSFVRVWDLETNALSFKMVGHAGKVSSVAFSPDGLTLASGSFDKTVILWDAKTVTQRATLQGHTSYVRAVAFSPDSKLVASGSTDQTVRLWDAATGAERAVLKGHTREVEAVDFSEDGLWLLSGSADQTIRIWEIATGKQVGVFEGNKSFVLGAAFSPAESLISVVGGDFIMRAYEWKVAAGQLTTKQRFPEIGSGGWDMATTFSPDGALIASACNSTSAFYVTPGEIHLYRSDTGFPVGLLRGHTKRVMSVTFSPNGKLVASGGADGSVRLWGVVHDPSRAGFVPTPVPPTSTPFASSYTFILEAAAGWADSGFDVIKGETIGVTASGEVRTADLNAYPTAFSGPDGQRENCPNYDNAPNCLLNNVPYGTLIGRIGAYGSPFVIGSEFALTPDASGDLYLAVNDLQPYLNDNSGSYTVVVGWPGSRPAGATPTTAPTAKPTATLPTSGNLALNRPVTASESKQYPARNAVDGNETTSWGAGAPAPQWIEIDLGAPATVTEIRLLIGQSPAGNTKHRLLVGTAQNDLVEVRIFDGFTRDLDWLVFKPGTSLENVQFIRVETLSSPSWVAWFEIEVIGTR